MDGLLDMHPSLLEVMNYATIRNRDEIIQVDAMHHLLMLRNLQRWTLGKTFRCRWMHDEKYA